MDPNYIRQLAEAYDAWLNNLVDIPVLTIGVDDLDFLAHESDLELVASQIERALREQTAAPRPAAAQGALLEGGRLAAFQQFHRQLDDSKNFDPDLYFNYVLLTEEMGELARELVNVWREGKQLAEDGRTRHEAHEEALNRFRPNLRSELADLLAYTLKLANYTGIDLEKAYLEKMRSNINREWPQERPIP